MTSPLTIPVAVRRTLSAALGRRSLGLSALMVGLASLTGAALADTPATRAMAAASSPLQSGLHLYGEVPTPDTLGATYMVLQVSQQRVVGAFYQPASSFDCFYGTTDSNRLALTVVDSYDQTAHPYSLALVSTTAIASTGATAAMNPVHPEGLQPIATISDRDRDILAVCLSAYPMAE